MAAGLCTLRALLGVPQSPPGWDPDACARPSASRSSSECGSSGLGDSPGAAGWADTPAAPLSPHASAGRVGWVPVAGAVAVSPRGERAQDTGHR